MAATLAMISRLRSELQRVGGECVMFCHSSCVEEPAPRLWPLSREAFPKQFHRPHRTSIAVSTDLPPTERRSLRRSFRPQQLPAPLSHSGAAARDRLTSANILLEPVGRNTAAAACIAALMAGAGDPEAVVLLAPSDHAIGDDVAFAECGKPRHLRRRSRDSIVTFGVQPDCPHTGYGYIETDDREGGANWALAVKRFVEKPSREVAETYLDSGRFYWNAGIFLFTAATMLEQFQMLRTRDPRRLPPSL